VAIQKMQRDKDWIASARLVSDENKYLFNLPAYAKMRLEKAGISQINIIAKDTFSNDNEFFSYRRSCKRGETAYGRQISAIVIK